MERAAGEEEPGELQESVDPAGGLSHEIDQWLPTPEWSDSSVEDMPAEPSGKEASSSALVMDAATEQGRQALDQPPAQLRLVFL